MFWGKEVRMKPLPKDPKSDAPKAPMGDMALKKRVMEALSEGLSDVTTPAQAAAALTDLAGILMREGPGKPKGKPKGKVSDEDEDD